MKLLSAILSPIGRWFLVASAVLLAVATFGASQRRAGRAEAKGETTIRTLETKDAQQQAAARAPVDRDGVVDRMQRGSF